MRITNSAHESVAVASHIARFRNSATGRLHREPNTANGSLTLKPRGEHGQVVAFQLVKTAALWLVLVEPFRTNDGRQRPFRRISHSPRYLGGRFSKKASMPSCWSEVVKATRIACRSNSTPASRGV